MPIEPPAELPAESPAEHRDEPAFVALPELIEIASGTVVLRDARSESARRVHLEPFAMARTQLTVAQWEAVAGFGRTELDPPGPPDIPIHPVTWFRAVSWCNAASLREGLEPAYAIGGRTVHWNVAANGYRLPTEAEWEFAARAGSTGPVYGELGLIAWTEADHVAGPQPVGGKQANAFGLHDMIGNLWEWCWDYADTARYGDYRSLRGAGWADRAWSARSSVRRGSAPDAVLEDTGLRVVRGAVGEPGADAAQGWSGAADARRAAISGPLPMGWTPLRPGRSSW